MYKNIVISLKNENRKKIKKEKLTYPIINVILKNVDISEIIKRIEEDEEYIEFKKENRKNFKKDKYNLKIIQIKIKKENYIKLQKIKEYLQISNSFLINKIIELFI